jgi:hypothetical protein
LRPEILTGCPGVSPPALLIIQTGEDEKARHFPKDNSIARERDALSAQ